MMRRWIKWLKMAAGVGLVGAGLSVIPQASAQSLQTVTAKMSAFVGTGCAGGTGGTQCYLTVTLRNYAGSVPRIVGSTLIAPVKQNVFPDASGNVSFTLYGNDLIQPLTCNPNGITGCTFYEFDAYYAGKLVFSGNWQFFGSGPFDITTLTPLNTTPPTPFSFPVLLNPNGNQTILGTFKLSIYNLEVRNYEDFDAVSQPANPPANVCRVWYSGTILSGINSSGASCMPTGGGGGGSITTVNGTASQITATNPGGPVVTLSLPNALTTPGSLSVTGNTFLNGSVLTIAGVVQSFAGIATTGHGLPSLVGQQFVTLLSGTGYSSTIYNTTAESGVAYRVNWTLRLSTAGSVDSQIGPTLLTYTQPGGTTVSTIVAYAMGSSQTNSNPTNINPVFETQDNSNDPHAVLIGVPVVIIPQPSTSIILSTTCSSVSSPTSVQCQFGYTLERM